MSLNTATRLLAIGLMFPTCCAANKALPNKTQAPTVDYNECSDSYGVDIRFFSFSLLVPLGLFFNTLALAVLFKSSMHKTTSGHYLAALAVADNISLIGNFILRFVDDKRVAHRFVHDNIATCQWTHFIRLFGHLFSSYLVVIITVERLLVIRFPLECNRKSTTTAKLAILMICVFCGLFATYPFWTLGTKSGCYIKNKLQHRIWSWIVIRIGQIILPGCIVLASTTMIIVTLRQLAKVRRDNLQVCSAGNRDISRNRQITSMLLAVAVVFIITRLPYNVVYMMYNYRHKIWPLTTSANLCGLQVALKTSEAFALVNYCINFFLYCLTGSYFRNQLWTMLRCPTVELRPQRLTKISLLTMTGSRRRKRCPVDKPAALNGIQAKS